MKTIKIITAALTILLLAVYAAATAYMFYGPALFANLTVYEKLSSMLRTLPVLTGFLAFTGAAIKRKNRGVGFYLYTLILLASPGLWFIAERAIDAAFSRA